MRVPLSAAAQFSVTNAVRPKTCTWVSPLGMVAVIESRRERAYRIVPAPLLG
jgi:hypothetical protein